MVKIEAGKRYRTRDGRVVLVRIVDAPGKYPIWGHHVDEAYHQDALTFTADGKKYYPPNSDSHMDLIAPVQTAEEVITETIPRLSGEYHETGGLSSVPYTEFGTKIAAALRAANLLKEDE